MKECYEYFNCKDINCPKHKIKDVPCWEIDGTLCTLHNNELKVVQETLGGKRELCKYCLYKNSDLS